MLLFSDIDEKEQIEKYSNAKYKGINDQGKTLAIENKTENI